VLQITKRAPEELSRRMQRYGESIGFLKLETKAAVTLKQLLDEKVKAGIRHIEHEQVYPELFAKLPFGCERVDGFAWMEIDTRKDLERARETVYSLMHPPVCLNRLISRVFFPWVVKLPVSPNQWTLVSFLLGLGSVFFIAQGGSAAIVWGAVLFQIFYMVDNWDGEVARAKGLSSRWGGWWDVAVDAVVQIGLPLALAMGLIRSGGPGWINVLGWIAASGLALDMGITSLAKWRGFGPSVFSDLSRDRQVLSDSPLGRWVRTNLTNENFSFLVIAVLLLDLRLPFLVAMAVGSHVFWMQFLWRERRRLLVRAVEGSSR